MMGASVGLSGLLSGLLLVVENQNFIESLEKLEEKKQRKLIFLVSYRTASVKF